MGKVTALTIGSPGRSQGTFKVRNFNLFDPDDLEEYAVLRNQANDASSGIRIEMLREYSRKKTETVESEIGPVTRSWEDIILMVQYWEKASPEAVGGENDGIREKFARSKG